MLQCYSHDVSSTSKTRLTRFHTEHCYSLHVSSHSGWTITPPVIDEQTATLAWSDFKQFHIFECIAFLFSLCEPLMYCFNMI